jgi:hypothetical protein
MPSTGATAGPGVSDVEDAADAEEDDDEGADEGADDGGDPPHAAHSSTASAVAVHLMRRG